MHILGKILAFLVVIAAIVASIFTSKLVMVRNSWTAKSVTSKNKFSTNLPEIEKLQAKIDSLKSELFRSEELWGIPWNGVETNIKNAAEGTLIVNIGTSNGVRQNLALHGFEIAADGSSIYRGSFSPTEVGDANATLKPNWRATAEDVSKWQGGNWRWRNALPSGYQDNFDRQLLAILKLEETLADRRRTLIGQKELLEQANDGLKMREAELVGGDVLEKSPSVEPEFRDGLVSAIEQSEEERNKTLQKVDELRRKVRNVQAEIERLQTENKELVQRLPEPGPRNAVTQKK